MAGPLYTDWEARKKSRHCFYCGKEFEHEAVVKVQLPYFPNLASHGEDDYRSDEWWAYFCSELCAWLDGLQQHKAWGMTEEEARKHLIGDHALTPPK